MSPAKRGRSDAGVDLPIVLVPHPHVRVDPNVLGGSPYVVGSRVVVRRLWAFFQNGASVERLMKRYPKLGPAKVLDALAFAFDNDEVIEADLEREARLMRRAGQPASGPRDGRQIELPFAGSGVSDAARPASRAKGGARGPR